MEHNELFSLSAEDGRSVFVEPASRVQWVEKLIHLTRFSDFTLVLEGVQGVGKTTLLRQLRPTAGDNSIVFTELTLSANTTVSELLNQLFSKLPDHASDSSDDRARLQYIYSHGLALRNAGQRWVLVIDEAHHLSSGALDLLLNFMSQNSGDGHPPQLLLAGEPQLANLLAGSSLAASMEGRIHQIALEPLSKEESLTYLKQKFPAIAQQAKKKQLKVAKEAVGLPSELDRLASMLIHTGKVGSGRKKSAAGAAAGAIAATQSDTALASGAESAGAVAAAKGAKAFPLSALQLTAVTAVLVGITSYAAWQFMPETDVMADGEANVASADGRVSQPLSLNLDGVADEDTETIRVDPVKNTARQELEKRLAAYENRAAEPVVLTEPAFTDDQPPLPVKKVVTELTPEQQKPVVKEKEAPKPEVSADSAVIVKKPAVERPLPAVQVVNNKAVVRPAPAKPVTPAAVVVTKKPEVKPAAAKPKPAAAKPAKAKPVVSAAGSLYQAREAELLKWNNGGYTLQLQGSRSANSAIQFLRAQANPKDFYYFQTIYKGGPWHVIVYGQFANRNAAVSAVKSLPADLQRLKPWARSVSGVKADIRKKNQ